MFMHMTSYRQYNIKEADSRAVRAVGDSDFRMLLTEFVEDNKTRIIHV